MRVECRNLRFNLEKELDRKAKETLLTVPNGQQNQFILNAICAYGEQQKAEDRQEQFAQRVNVFLNSHGKQVSDGVCKNRVLPN